MLLDTCDKIKVRWGNQAEIRFHGWADSNFQMTTESNEPSDE